MGLDYSALNQPVTKADIAAFKQSRHKQGKTPIILYTLLAIVGLVMVGVGFGVIRGDIRLHSVMPVIVFFVIISLFGAIIAVFSWVRTRKLAKLYKFAVQNKLTFKADVFNPDYAGMIFDEGHSRQINEALVFPDGTEIGNYQYTVGGGKNQTTYRWSYIRIKLTRRLPNMVLDAKKNNLFGRLSNLPDSFNKKQTLALEGDFNNYFTLYAPKEYERDALYIFTPDVMAAMIDAGQAYDMEAVDDNLMIYSSRSVRLDSQEQLARLLTIIDKIGSEIRDQSHRYADERVGDRTQNIVAEPGRRLKGGLGTVTITILVIMAAYYIFSFLVSR